MYVCASVCICVWEGACVSVYIYRMIERSKREKGGGGRLNQGSRLNREVRGERLERYEGFERRGRTKKGKGRLGQKEKGSLEKVLSRSSEHPEKAQKKAPCPSSPLFLQLVVMIYLYHLIHSLQYHTTTSSTQTLI